MKAPGSFRELSRMDHGKHWSPSCTGAAVAGVRHLQGCGCCGGRGVNSVRGYAPTALVLPVHHKDGSHKVGSCQVETDPLQRTDFRKD